MVKLQLSKLSERGDDMNEPAKPPDTTLLDQSAKTYQSGSKAASWVFGAVLIGFLMYSFIFMPHLTPAQCGMLRFFMALTAGLFFLFFVGGIVLQGHLKGFGVGAGGGVALFFLIQFVVNPVPGCVGPASKSVEWTGGQHLGSLIEMLRSARASGEANIPSINYSAADEDRVTHFDPKLDKVTGKTWSELLQRICDSTNGCLACETSQDQQTVTLSTRGTWSKNLSSNNRGEYSYSCR